MFERFSRSLELAKASFAVLRQDKELLLFPFVSFIGLVLVTISFAIPFIAVYLGTPDGQEPNNVVLAVIGFFFYLATYTVIFFFNTALVGAAMIRLDGGDPTVRDGLRIAVSRLPSIIVYALIAATVGMILRWISERAGIVGAILAGLIGFAWSIATFLVVPVLVVEKVGPIAAIRRSASLLRQTWGEQLVGNFGIGVVFGLLAFAVGALGFALVWVLATISSIAAVAGIVAVVLIVGAIILVGAAVQGIFTASLYRYATKGDAGTSFRSDTLAGAFRSKGGAAQPGFGRPA